jgi:NADPH:quinone reductase-like Zn-dependent oxidoreductase
MEFAGEVAAVGDAVKGWNIGDRVFGITAGEAQAEFLKVDASLLASIPENLSFSEAAGVPEVFITAHDAILTRAELRSGETLLIHAVGSGVGLAGLQIAKAFGASVIGTSRTPDKLERSREFGLDHGIVTTGSDFAETVVALTNSKGANVILDLVGGAYFDQNLQALALKGRIILVGLTSGREANFNLGLALQRRATIIGTTLRGRSVAEKADATRRFVADVIPHLASGLVRPNIDRIFAADDVVAAYEYLASNESFGKVVLEF